MLQKRKGKTLVTPEEAEFGQIEEEMKLLETTFAGTTANKDKDLTESQEGFVRRGDQETLARIEGDRKKSDDTTMAVAAERLKRSIEEETKRSRDDSKDKEDKAPIRYKDAVGLKSSFPFHLCHTWQVRIATGI